MAAGALVLSLVVSHSSVALVPSSGRQDYAWTQVTLRPTDAPGAPETPVPASTPTPRAVEAPRPTPRPEVTTRPHRVVVAPRRSPKKVLPVSGTSISGLASWYCQPSRSICTSGYSSSGMYAAAGPKLRAAIGRSWRGRRIVVCNHTTCRNLTLIDWCQCHRGTSIEKVIDLYHAAWTSLEAPTRVVIRW